MKGYSKEFKVVETNYTELKVKELKSELRLKVRVLSQIKADPQKYTKFGVVLSCNKIEPLSVHFENLGEIHHFETVFFSF